MTNVQVLLAGCWLAEEVYCSITYDATTYPGSISNGAVGIY